MIRVLAAMFACCNQSQEWDDDSSPSRDTASMMVWGISPSQLGRMSTGIPDPLKPSDARNTRMVGGMGPHSCNEGPTYLQQYAAYKMSMGRAAGVWYTPPHVQRDAGRAELGCAYAATRGNGNSREGANTSRACAV
jgi:hypothetical protein